MPFGLFGWLVISESKRRNVCLSAVHYKEAWFDQCRETFFVLTCFLYEVSVRF